MCLSKSQRGLPCVDGVTGRARSGCAHAAVHLGSETDVKADIAEVAFVPKCEETHIEQNWSALRAKADSELCAVLACKGDPKRLRLSLSGSNLLRLNTATLLLL